MKKFLLFALPLYLVGAIYLLLPEPHVAALPDSVRSDEPGDTWQHPDQSAYFTGQNRSQVLDFYQSSFALKLFNFSLPSYRLNYRPEDTAVYVREQIQSYYLEEIVHPLRESLFVNGWDPQKSPLNAYMSPESLKKQTILFHDQEYMAKITLKPYYSSPLARLLVWTIIFPTSFYVLKFFQTSLKSFFSNLPFALSLFKP